MFQNQHVRSLTEYFEAESDGADALVVKKDVVDKENFMPGLLSLKTIRQHASGGEQKSPYEVLDGYKIETDMDRKLLLGVWEEL